MPEGDTLFRTALNLRPVLAGRQIVAASSRQLLLDADALVGSRVMDVQSRGKHLLVHLESGGAIHSHMGMTGSWHVYSKGHRWQKPESQAALAIETDEQRCAVCFTPKIIELLTSDGLRRHRWLNRLGPDILAEEFDVTQVAERLGRHSATPLGEAIMDQSIFCGLGNVYKSEVLFLEGLDPFLPISEFGMAALCEMLTHARHLMKSNLISRPRRTRFRTDGSRKWVYDRSGEPCLRCSERIDMRRQGDLGRSTYFCAHCQSVMRATRSF